MNGEILSLETAQRIRVLEKENQDLYNIVAKFDTEVNRQYNLIKKIKTYCESNKITELLEIIEESEKNELKRINNQN